MAYNFDNENIRWPFGEAKKTVVATFVATMNVSVNDRLNLVTLPSLTANATLNITPDANQLVGDLLVLSVPASADGNNLTLGNMIDGPAIVGVASKTKNQTFVYDGSNFVATGAAVQIN